MEDAARANASSADWSAQRAVRSSRLPRAKNGVLLSSERLRQHVYWFVQMRWVAVAVVTTSVIVAVPIAGILPPAAFDALLAWSAVLIACNVVFAYWSRRGSRLELQIVVQAATDLVILTGLLNASGGIENPIYIAYLFHVIIPGILLPRRKALALTLVAGGLFLLLAFGEYLGFLPHYTNALFPHGQHTVTREEHGHEAGGAEHDREVEGPGNHASHDLVFVAGRVVPFLGVLLLTSYLTTLVAERLRRSERDLEEAARSALLEHERLESVIDAARVGMMLVAPDASIRWQSLRAAQFLGWGEEVVGRHCPLDDRTAGCERCIAAETAVSGQALEAERVVVEEGEALRHFRHATSPVRDADGSVVQVVELVEEITARKALEAEVLHAGKLSVLGRMAAGIAHEIGNPLSSVGTRLRLMERKEEPDFLKQSVGVLRTQIGRIERIVRGISQFSRSSAAGWTLWELNPVMEEALEIVKLDRRARSVEFRANLAPPSPRVRGIRDQISQVFLNLLLNAVEAMPDGGTVTVRTSRAGRVVRAVVADTGVGMDESTRARLFEPFFTTKKSGTGLGLSISYSLVHAHGGSIEVISRLGKGSRFMVVLPTAEAEGEAMGRKDPTTS